MNNIKLSNFEAIAIILTVTVTHSILTLPKSIMAPIGSASLLNIAYVSVLALILSIIVYKLLNKFPGLDIIDICEILGGKLLKRLVGFAFLAYILFVSSVLLRTFSHCLKIVYYPMTDLIFIIAIFAISVPISCALNSETVFKANLIIIPIVLLSIVFLFYLWYDSLSKRGNAYGNLSEVPEKAESLARLAVLPVLRDQHRLPLV